MGLINVGWNRGGSAAARGSVMGVLVFGQYTTANQNVIGTLLEQTPAPGSADPVGVHFVNKL